MSSVTQRIEQVKQPRGGYLKPSDMTIAQLKDSEVLAETESVTPGLMGTAVDYMTRLMLGAKAVDAFDISLTGARIIHEDAKCFAMVSLIKGLDDQSLINALKVVGYDVCLRVGPIGYRPVDMIEPDEDTISNLRIMVKRSLAFFKEYGPIVLDGFTFEGAYTPYVASGDGDYLTADTLWEFKILAKEPTNKHTLQLLMYYLMGLHSKNPIFKQVRKVGIFNPRLNRVYLYDLTNFPADALRDIEKNVIGY